MSGTVNVACVQVNAGPEIGPNLAQAESLIRAAAEQGAELIALPENISRMVMGRDKLFAQRWTEDQHPALPVFRRLAAETRTWLLGGTLAIDIGGGRLANRSYLFTPEGGIAAFYDKIHMFDVDLGNGETYRESDNFRPGDRAVVAATPWGGLGMSVCYDVRFPHLYRMLAKAGAKLLAVPAAFTRPTGAAHWHILLRARAIETGCFVLAPAQCGPHDGGRQTYGHSLIVGPWGDILAEAGEAPALITATLDLGAVEEARRKIPAWQEEREFRQP